MGRYGPFLSYRETVSHNIETVSFTEKLTVCVCMET
jgi:hypothetical protein